MAINGIGGSGFNPYANGVVAPRPSANTGVSGTSNHTSTPQRSVANTTDVATSSSVAEAIKNDASARAQLINSPQAPDGVDQDLWSVLSREERSFFVKAGAMGPLTYGRFSQAQPAQTAPLMRGGRLDIKA